MIEWYKIVVPFLGTLLGALIAGGISVYLNYRQNKNNNRKLSIQFENSIKEIEMKHQLTTEWNSKKELLSLKTSQAEVLINNIEYIRQNIIEFSVSEYKHIEKEYTKEYRANVSKAMVASCYFPKHKILFGEIMTNCLNFSLELNDQLELEHNHGNEITVEKGREIISEKHDKLAKEIQVYVIEISEEIRLMISELEKTA